MLTNTLCLLTSFLTNLACASSGHSAFNNTSSTPDISNIAAVDKVLVGSIIRTELTPLLSKSGEISLLSDGDSWRHRSRRYSHFQEPPLAAVVIVKSEDDILTTIKYAKESKRTLLVKGGGNGLAKMSHLQDVILLDLSEMNKVTLNMNARTMTVQPGARVEEMIEEIAYKKFRSPFPTSDCVGVIGATLGGGHGVFDGEYGLMSDNLLSLDMITAKGENIFVNATENPDLFWGIKGAGNNFGLITEATYRVYLKTTLFHFTIEADYSPDNLEQLFKAVNEPDVFPGSSSTVYFLPDRRGPQNDPNILLVFVYHGNPGPGKEAFERVYGHIPRIKMTEFPTRYSRLNTETESLIPLLECNPEGWGYEYRKNQFSVSMKTLDPGVIALVYDEFSSFVRSHHVYYSSIVKFESTRMKRDDTAMVDAYAHRDQRHHATLLLSYDEEINDAIATEFGYKIRELLQHNTGNNVPHVLPNYARGDEPLGALYGYDMGRLNKPVALKRKYDPEQFFSAMTPIPLELPEDVLAQTENKDDNRLKIQEVLDGKKKKNLMEGMEEVEQQAENAPETAGGSSLVAKEGEGGPEIIGAKLEEHTPARTEGTRQEVGPNEL
ncbi:hypothetical protein HOY82DRAFT_615032 [Tuber indicum]|nr:hypothetical protein HOY82DRAFT_615032 [Tuber indicum]